MAPAVQETGTGLCMSGCTSKALGNCSFRKGLLAKSLGPICGTYQLQGMVRFAFVHPCIPICTPIILPNTAVTAGDQSLETAQRETQEELGIDVPVEVGKEHACMMRHFLAMRPSLIPHSANVQCQCAANSHSNKCSCTLHCTNAVAPSTARYAVECIAS